MVMVTVSVPPPVVIGAVLIAVKTHSFVSVSASLLVTCFVQVLPFVSEISVCVEQLVEPNLKVCTEMTSTSPAFMALPVVTETDEQEKQ